VLLTSLINQKSKRFLAIVGIAVISLAGSGRVEAQFSQIVSISGTALTQSAQNSQGGIPAPSRTAITTESLLKQLAADAYANGSYSTNVFPAGTRLAFTSLSGFGVIDKHGNVLIDVTNILTLQPSGSNELSSSTSSDGWSVQTYSQLVTLTFDTTSIGGRTRFSATGLGRKTVSTHGLTQYVGLEVDTVGLQGATGEGTNSLGNGIIVTGLTITGKGTGKTYSDAGLGGFSLTVAPPSPPPPTSF
jgi:hypothetical protein